MSAPQRIVCLSAEAADWLWRIGAWGRVVGVTAFVSQPIGAPPKPRISGFSTANLEAITRLEPDLIITFSDVQAALAGALVHRGFTILATNQRTLAEIETTLALIARIADCEAAAKPLLQDFHRQTEPEPVGTPRPRVYFEEWNDPLVSGIAWVSELIERAGGEDLFAALRTHRSAADRVVKPEQVCAGEPEIILASWCGQPVDCGSFQKRPGWENLPVVRSRRIHEIAGEDILQAGYRLVYGYQRIKQLLKVSG